MSKLTDVIEAISLLNNEYPRPGIPDPLQLSQEFRIPEDYEKKSFPFASYPGVYLFFDENETLLYIGKASSGLGQRIGNEYIGRSGVLKTNKISGAKVLRTIKLPKEHHFEAPAIEEFLIYKLKPTRNSVGK